MRLFVNFFQPSFKLQEKQRDGAQITKRYHAPLTPYQRILARSEIDQATKEDLTAQFSGLDPPKSTAGDGSATDALRYVGTPHVSGTPPPAAIEG